MKTIVEHDMTEHVRARAITANKSRHPLVISEQTARAVEAEGVSTEGCIVIPSPTQEPEVLAIDIRPATGDDVPWIYSSWLKSFREHGSGIVRVPRETYYKHQRQRIEKTTSTSGVATIVACAAENNEQILGWLCGAVGIAPYDAVFYYGHVKSTHRRQGIMRAMVAAFGMSKASQCAYTHHTKLSWIEADHLKSLQLSDITPLSWHYNPYLFT